MVTRYAFIVNPISGRKGRIKNRVERVQDFVARHGLQAEVTATRCAGHATELARAAIESGVDRIVCVGGDGTINEVGRVLVGSGVAFALVPMGSGNGLARHLGIPLEFEKALAFSISDNVRLVDTGEANGRPFFNVMGVGFDAEIGRRFNQTKTRGFWSYLREGWLAFQSYRAMACEIEAEGLSRKVNAYVLAVANSSQYGSNAFIAPDASLTDGKLNLVAIAPPGFTSLFVLTWRMFSKKLYQSPRVTPICSAFFRLKLPSSSFYHVDGEIFETGPELVVRALPGSLKLIAPGP